MTTRVLVEYYKGHCEAAQGLLGDQRWLDKSTMQLYSGRVSRYCTLPEHRFVPDPAAPGQWVSPFATVREVAQEAPAPKPGQAFKADAGKPDFALLTQGCPTALRGVVEVLSFAVRPKEQGGKGYEPHSWRQVPDNKRRYESALHRHLNAINLGEELDDESGLSHWYHVATNALFLAEVYNEKETT